MPPFYENKTTGNALQLMNLKGNVKSLLQVSNKAIDNAGIITKGEEAVDGSDNIGKTPTVNSFYKMQFDSSGRATEEMYFHGKTIDMTLKHKYNDATKTEEIVQYETPGTASFRYTYKYNDKGKIMEERSIQIYYDNRTFDQKFTFKYNSLFQLTEKETFSLNNKKYVTGGKTLYTCDNKGNILTEGYLNNNLPCLIAGYKYDAKGNMLEHNYYSSCGKVIEHQFIFKYDSSNNVIQKDIYQSGKLEKSYTYTYEYDKKGNWIKRIDFENKKAAFILERVLTYY